MSHLSLSLLGPFRVALDGEAVTGFKSNKVRALLAYLAVEADQPHRREVLAGLLWPDWPDRDALSNLRYTLADLRRAIGDRSADPPCLLITRDTVQFNPAADYTLDAAMLADVAEQMTPPATVEQLAAAAASYRGAFLEGFSLGDSPPFEEWHLLTRERLARQVSAVLHRLAAAHEQRGDFELAESYARRQIELEPYDEAAHQQLMRALALGGRRSAALVQYETCRRLLADELAVEPAGETTTLYQEIRTGMLQAPLPAARIPEATVPLPPFLEVEQSQVEVPLFVARERELAQLDRCLGLALSGRGRIFFVTGEVGSGKTSLLQEFGRRAQAAHAGLVFAAGNGNAYTGIGDPYLPFREILELLTGDVEARFAAGAISSEHARCLWHARPLTCRALAEVGPDLIDTFVRGAALLERLAAQGRGPGSEAWLIRLEELATRKTHGAGMPSPQQSDLFQQYTGVLKAVARQAPLLLAVDDLQWADTGSINLLFHLGRQLAGSRILILGAYRPEEVALGREGGRHPLEPVVNELQRSFGEIGVDLGQAESRDFLDALLDSEPNRLEAGFREMLFRQTRGHPLFTVELLRGLQERGDLVRNAEGHWTEGAALDWDALPARAEAVIAERIGRLAQPLQSALRVASVEGEVFTAEVLARVRGAGEQEMLQCLSGELDRRHRLVRAQSIQRMDGRLLSCYRFRHILFQKYLYGSLDQVERVHLHDQVGSALEELYGAQEQAVAVQLALHFQKARSTPKAVHYLHQAGVRAVQLSAYDEGRAHLGRALELLMTLPDSPGRAEQELAVQISLGHAWMGTIPQPKWVSALLRARELCRQLGKTAQLTGVLSELATMHYVRCEHREARALAEEGLVLADQIGDPLLIAASNWYIGFVLFSMGEYTAAHAHLGRTIDFYEPQQHHHRLVLLRGSDAGTGALAYQACCLWCLGYPDQAIRHSRRAIALAREFGHVFSLVDALTFGGCVFHSLLGNAEALRDAAQELEQVSARMEFASFQDTGTCYLGEALVKLGREEEGIAVLREGLAARRATETRCHGTQMLGVLAEAQVRAGRPEEGLVTLAEAVAQVEETDERHWEADLLRLKGDLLLAQGDESGAEACWERAIAVARTQQAKSWELRATICLARLWQHQGRPAEAHRTLADVYNWFTEGFDTPDLKAAGALLAELS